MQRPYQGFLLDGSGVFLAEAAAALGVAAAPLISGILLAAGAPVARGAAAGAAALLGLEDFIT